MENQINEEEKLTSTKKNKLSKATTQELPVEQPLEQAEIDKLQERKKALIKGLIDNSEKLVDSIKPLPKTQPGPHIAKVHSDALDSEDKVQKKSGDIHQIRVHDPILNVGRGTNIYDIRRRSK